MLARSHYETQLKRTESFEYSAQTGYFRVPSSSLWFDPRTTLFYNEQTFTFFTYSFDTQDYIVHSYVPQPEPQQPTFSKFGDEEVWDEIIKFSVLYTVHFKMLIRSFRSRTPAVLGARGD